MLSVPLLGAAPFTVGGLLTSAAGFYFDFMSGATGAGIASVTSQSPSTKTGVQATGTKQPVWTDGTPDYALFDGTDDSLRTNLNPAAAMTIGVCFRITLGGKFAIGSTTNINERAGLVGLNASGYVCSAWGGDGTATIAGAVDKRTFDVVVVFRGNASRVCLHVDGVSVYDAAANLSTVPNTTVPYEIGAINVEGTASSHMQDRIYRVFAVQSFIADADVVPLSRELASGVIVI